MAVVYFRALELSDLERSHKWHNNQEMYATMGGTFHFVSLAAEEEWLRKRIAWSSTEENMAVCLTEDNQHVGNFYIRNIDWISRTAEVHMFIGETGNRARGFGVASVRLAMKHAFQDLGLRRLWTFMLADNMGSIRTTEKCGFVQEGLLRRHAFKNGVFKDVLVMGVCSDDLPVDFFKED